MARNFEINDRNRLKKIHLSYAFAVLCLYDWIYKLFQIILRFDFLSIGGYFVHVFNVWRSHTLITTLVLIVCAFGIPKFLVYFRKSFDVLKKLMKSIIKTPTIINLPFLFYLFIISLKFGLLTSNFFNQDRNESIVSETTVKIEYWKEIRQSLTLYRYSTLITIVLFLLGIYSAATNRFVQRITKNIFSIFTKQFKTIRQFLFISIPTPLSLIMLIVLNLSIRLFPNVSRGVYHFVTHRWVIYLGVVFIILYRLYKWFWPKSKMNVDIRNDILLNDVSGLNETRVYCLYYPRTMNDIEHLICRARNEGRTISIRGQAHTMGGQTLPSRKDKVMNYVCDLKYMHNIEYDEERKEVLVESGATWTHVIKKLNVYGRSPVVMQSYCTFSVGGTISVNAHGITSDDAMCQSVMNIEYIDANGKRGECNREKDPELFSLMIGGYGLFGIIIRLRLKTVANVKTSLEYIRLQVTVLLLYCEIFI